MKSRYLPMLSKWGLIKTNVFNNNPRSWQFNMTFIIHYLWAFFHEKLHGKLEKPKTILIFLGQSFSSIENIECKVLLLKVSRESNKMNFGYAPESMVMTTVPVGPTPQRMTCMFCNNSIVTRVEYNASSKTHLMAILLCLITGCCCCIPYCMRDCSIKLNSILIFSGFNCSKNANHYCSQVFINCGISLIITCFAF